MQKEYFWLREAHEKLFLGFTLMKGTYANKD